jgi:hypothetical protein
MLVGNCVGLGSSGLIALIGSYFQPEHYDWAETRAINTHKQPIATAETIKEVNQTAAIDSKTEKRGTAASARPASPNGSFDHNAMAFDEGGQVITVEVAELRKAFKLAGQFLSFPPANSHIAVVWSSIILCLILVIIVPLSLFGSGYVFSERSFTAWVSFFIAWLFAASFYIIFGPIFEVGPVCLVASETDLITVETRAQADLQRHMARREASLLSLSIPSYL